MTENRQPTYRGATRTLAWMVILLTGTLQGCGPSATPGPAGSKLRVFAADLSGGAKSCEVSKVTPVSGQTAEEATKLVNDGGWWGVSVHQNGPKPFDAGLLTARPAHGSVLIHEVGDDTRIDYTPDRGFAGTDSFSVKLIPGDDIIHETVTVTAPAK
jgi:hypothetical protein